MLHLFDTPIHRDSLPKKFPFPFYHKPSPISLLAAEKVKSYLTDGQLSHDFKKKGKMFGVLVVEDARNQLGFLVGFSGKLQNDERPLGFVPPIVDVHKKNSFYKRGEETLDQITLEIKRKKSDPSFLKAKILFDEETLNYEAFVTKNRQEIKSNKAQRKDRRNEAANKKEEEQVQLFYLLDEESRKEQFAYKREKKNRAATLLTTQEKYSFLEKEIQALKTTRSVKSKELQNAVFEKCFFMNFSGEKQNLLELFKDSFEGVPPAGAGECAAPRLLQSCFSLGFRPITFTEFWWGSPPKKELRAHGVHYPACKGKCEPILNHMLVGLPVEESSLDQKQASLQVKVLYNDPSVMVVDKPSGLLSVPGKYLKQCVVSVVKKQLNLSGPLFPVHRLDRQTSGVLLLAKSKGACAQLQKQFEKRTVKKTYVALLNGAIKQKKGTLSLPLRADYNDRPRQLVCFERGKLAETAFELKSIENDISRVIFYPKTGRSHQLRVHAAFHKGLNAPILGDDLYGKHDERLFLHAEKLVFEHPVTKEELVVVSPMPF